MKERHRKNYAKMRSAGATQAECMMDKDEIIRRIHVFLWGTSSRKSTKKTELDLWLAALYRRGRLEAMRLWSGASEAEINRLMDSLSESAGE